MQTLEIDPTVTEQPPVEKPASELRFEQSQKEIASARANIVTLETFIANHREQLDTLQWSMWGWPPRIDIRRTNDKTPSQIVRLFTMTGWKATQPYPGANYKDWENEFEGVKLKIEHAEEIAHEVEPVDIELA